MKVGMQFYSFSPLVEAGKFDEAMRMACRSAVDGLELYSHYDVPALTYRKLLNEAGIACIGTHNHWTPLRDDLDSVMEYNYVLGNETILCHYLLEEERGSRDNYLRVAESLNGIGAVLRRNGFRLLYHNHDFEFAEVFDGKCGMDLLLENTDPCLVGLELHIGQLPHFDIDIPGYIKKLGGRIKLLHVHAFSGEEAFDSAPAVAVGKELGIPYAILENVYPADTEPGRVQADVAKLRDLTRR